MRSLDRPLRIMTVLALAAAVSASARTPAEAQAAAEPARPAAMTDSARIKLCEQKKDLPLEPAGSPPSRIEGKVVPAKLLRKVDPRFDQSGPHGIVLLEALIDEDGCVRQVKILRSLGPGQDAAAADAVRQWVFRPALYNGAPLRVYYSLTLSSH